MKLKGFPVPWDSAEEFLTNLRRGWTIIVGNPTEYGTVDKEDVYCVLWLREWAERHAEANPEFSLKLVAMATRVEQEGLP